MLRSGMIMAAVLLCGGVSIAAARDRTRDECVEGSEFVEHAAQSREAGLSREYFLDKVRSDLEAIRIYPPELRWFAQSPEDEQLLTQAVESVFDRPADPADHGRRFLEQCLAAGISVAPAIGPRDLESVRTR